VVVAAMTVIVIVVVMGFEGRKQLVCIKPRRLSTFRLDSWGGGGNQGCR
jgi:hypothetical protein